MTANRDNQQRAADFLRQWQAEMTRQMTNPDAIRAMLDAMQHFGKGDPHDANARRPAHASDARNDAIRDFAQRLIAVEQQLAKLHERMDAVDAKAKKPARTGKRAHAESLGRRKRAMANPTQGKSVAKPAGRKKRTTKRN